MELLLRHDIKFEFINENHNSFQTIIFLKVFLY